MALSLGCGIGLFGYDRALRRTGSGGWVTNSGDVVLGAWLPLSTSLLWDWYASDGTDTQSAASGINGRRLHAPRMKLAYCDDFAYRLAPLLRSICN